MTLKVSQYCSTEKIKHVKSIYKFSKQKGNFNNPLFTRLSREIETEKTVTSKCSPAKEHLKPKNIKETIPTSLALLGEWLSLKGSTELGSSWKENPKNTFLDAVRMLKKRIHFCKNVQIM